MSRGPATAALAGLALAIALGAYFLARGGSDSSSIGGDAPGAEPREPPSDLSRLPELASQVDVASAAPRESMAPPAGAEVAPTEPIATAEDATILVRVVSKSTRLPLEGIRVHAIRLDTEDPVKLETVEVDDVKGRLGLAPRTGPDGRVELAVPPGIRFAITAMPDDSQGGYAQTQVPELRPGQRREIVLEVRVGFDLRFVCRVVDGADRRPIADALARVVRRDAVLPDRRNPDRSAWNGQAVAEARTGDDGLFAFDLESWRGDHVRVEADGYGLAFLQPAPGHEGEDRALDLALQRGATLEATLLDAGGAPLHGVTVRLSVRGHELDRVPLRIADTWIDLPDERWLGETGDDGRTVLPDLPPEVELLVEILRGEEILRREPDPLVLRPGQVLGREWRIGSGTTLLGRAVDAEDRPVPGLTIWLVRTKSELVRYFDAHDSKSLIGKATSDDEGRFQFDDVAEGRWWIGPAASDFGSKEPALDGAAPLATPIEVMGTPTQPVLLRVHLGLSIRGVLLDSKGERARQGAIHASMGGVQWGPQADVAEDGTFALGPLAPGRFTLTADSWGDDAPSDPVHAESGTQDLVLRLRPGGGLRGKVVDAASGEAIGAEMLITPESPRPGIFGSGVGFSTREDGWFEHSGLEPGAYGVSARTPDGKFGVAGSVLVSAGEAGDELRLSVSPGGTLDVRYEGSSDRIRAYVLLSGVRISWGTTLKRGELASVPSPAGALRLEFQALGGASGVPLGPRTIELRPGERKEIVLRDGE